MTDAASSPREPGRDGEDAGGPGVFSALPRSRPSVRSPRRAELPPEEPAPEAQEPEAPERSGLLAGREEEIEALARASVTLAGGVASLGLKAAGRAAAAVRDVVERR